ncbi:MAG: hypothetical protein OQK35_01425 [Alphaproteobacteria bacterium]|nr:hypothetical protein [Rhodospirillales bacterium]MCW9044970.1 hypothetical protein [Alphaproteobacteria bacterium]
MAKSSTGRRGAKSSSPRRGSKNTRSRAQRAARILTVQNCIKRPGRRARAV